MPRATVMMGVPTFYTRLLQSPRADPESTRTCACSSPARRRLLAETHREFEARTGHAILERYGMTETNMNTSNPYDGERVPGQRRPCRCPACRVRVTDPETGRPLPHGRDRHDRGHAAPTCSRATGGCPRRPRPSSATTASSSPATSASIDADGYVHIVGRGKDLIISGGFNVYPKEVESAIDALPGVVEMRRDRRAAPRFRRGRDRGGGLRQGRQALDEASMLAALDGRLAKFKLPKRVILVDDLPRNAMGKVQKNLLRDTYARIYAK